jgi:hypothetical protein
MKTENLSLDLLRIDGDTQNRAGINEDTVADYAELIQEAGGEWPFPPLDVFHDGTDYFTADGFHRQLGAVRAKRSSAPCNIHKGTAKDAKIFGMTANDRHGLRMTRAEKRACVCWLLDNGGKMTQAEIATKAGVTSRAVRQIVADRNAESLQGKLTPPKQDSKRKTSSNTPSRGGNEPAAARGPEPEPIDQDEPDDLDTAEPTDAEILGTNGENFSPPSPAGASGKKASGAKPAVSGPDCKALFKEYDRAIGPLVRLVDRIAGQVNGKNGDHHKTVQDHLNIATEEMMEWMGVAK